MNDQIYTIRQFFVFLPVHLILNNALHETMFHINTLCGCHNKNITEYSVNHSFIKTFINKIARIFHFLRKTSSNCVLLRVGVFHGIVRRTVENPDGIVRMTVENPDNQRPENSMQVATKIYMTMSVLKIQGRR